MMSGKQEICWYIESWFVVPLQKDSGGWREILVDVDDLSEDESKLLRFIISSSPTATSRLLLQDAVSNHSNQNTVKHLI